MRKLSLLLVVCLLVSSLSGCGLMGAVIGNVAGDMVDEVMSDTLKSHTVGSLTIQIPSNMKDVSREDVYQGYTSAVSNDKTAIIILKESRADIYGGDEMTVDTYVQMMLEAYELETVPQTRQGKDYQYFIYDASSEGMDFRYLGAAFAAEDAFWFIQIYSLASDFEQDTFLSYLDTVSFQ